MWNVVIFLKLLKQNNKENKGLGRWDLDNLDISLSKNNCFYKILSLLSKKCKKYRPVNENALIY